MSFAGPLIWRRLLRHPPLRRAACWAIHCYIRLAYCTNRWRVEGGETPRRLLAEGRVFIGAFWHGRMLMIPMVWRRMAPMNMLVSAHRDGRIIADAVSYFGIEAIAGSTRRGGSAALRNMLKKLKEGACVAITPDGPRGPAMNVSIGIVNAARLAQVPIVPVTYSTSRRRIFASWDRFHVALPFGHGVFLWGEPIEIAAELDETEVEHARRLIEARMVEMVHEADRRVGHAPPPAKARVTAPTSTGNALSISIRESLEAVSCSPSAARPQIASRAGAPDARVPPSPRLPPPIPSAASGGGLARGQGESQGERLSRAGYPQEKPR